MRKFMYRVGVVVSLILSITGCSGGDDAGAGNGNSSGGGLGSSSISPSSYVSGSFKSTFDYENSSSAIAQHLNAEYQNDLGYCGYGEGLSSDRYYESARVIVVGSDALPEDDFRWGATLGELAMDRALSAMKLTYSEYLDMKSGLSTAAARSTLDMMESIDQNNSGYETDLVHYQSILTSAFDGEKHRHSYMTETVPAFSTFAQGLANGDESSRRAFRIALAAMPADEELALYNDLSAEFDKQGAYRDVNIGATNNIDKMVVCLSAQRSNSKWGMGTRQGFEVAAKSATQRGDDVQIATHEVIHHLQVTVTEPTSGNIALERWFSEGQAVKLSGMKVNSGNHSRRTLDVKGFVDVANVYPNFDQNEYPDYGQAYNWFISKFGPASQFDILYAMRADASEELDVDSNSQTFINSFNALSKVNCTYDCDYELSDYRTDYPNQSK